MSEDYSQRPSENTQYQTRTVSTDVVQRPNAMADQQQTFQQKKAVWRSYNIIWFAIGLIDAVLVFRFIFELLGANPGNAFVTFIYTLSYPFAGPFQTILGVTSVASSMFDWSLLVGMVVYLLIGYALVQLLRIIRPVTPEDVNHHVNTI